MGKRFKIRPVYWIFEDTFNGEYPIFYQDLQWAKTTEFKPYGESEKEIELTLKELNEAHEKNKILKREVEGRKWKKAK